jgi:hypothetical protein
MHQFDLERTGVNPFETKITPANAANLGLAGVFPVGGYVYAQPLVVHQSDLAALGPLSLPGGRVCGSGATSTGYSGSQPVNLLVIATMTNW